VALTRKLDGGSAERTEFQRAIAQGGEEWVRYMEAADTVEQENRSAAA